MSAFRKLLMGAVVGAAIILPTAAMARVSIIYPPTYPPYDRPVCPDPPVGYYYRWVPPVYRTVYDRVWVEESTQQVQQWVEIAPGKWQQRWVTITIPAHWETTTHRELVSTGYWELVRITPPPPPYYPPIEPMPLPRPMVVSPGTVGVDGYSRGAGEDLSKFSPLYEWPDKK